MVQMSWLTEDTGKLWTVFCGGPVREKYNRAKISLLHSISNLRIWSASMKTVNYPRRNGGTSVNLMILVVILIGSAIGYYLYANRTRPFLYESSGNVIEFGNVDLARDCVKIKDLEFQLNDFDFKFSGSYTGTRGLIELHTGFELKVSGMISGSDTTLPFTRAELIQKIEEVVDEKLGNNSESKVVELSVPKLKGSDKSDPAKKKTEKTNPEDKKKTEGDGDKKEDDGDKKEDDEK